MSKNTLLKSLSALTFLSGLGNAASSCKNIPGDKGWPSSRHWARLNQTVGGRLIETVPMPSVCHEAPYNAFNQGMCDALKSNWLLAETYVNTPAEVMNGYFQNQTCDPFTPADQSCELGNRASYSIAVTGAADVVAGLRFAKQHNIRLVIKNTGHDFLGKSTGKGSLSLWTHNLKDIDIIPNYRGDSGYRGPAAKLGAGVEAGEAYSVVGEKGYRIIGGACPSVGLAGGYTAGGGHGLLNSKYGMAADAVLEWEVVTPKGEHLVATPKRNSDLYWALSGGGAGTYAVVLSMTTKIFPEGPVGAGFLSFNVSSVTNTSASANETFWEAIGDWFEFMPSFTDGGHTIIWQMSESDFRTNSIAVMDKDASALEDLMAPYLAKLQRRGIAYTFESRTDESYFVHAEKDLGPFPYGEIGTNVQLTTRLIPRAAVLDSKQRPSIMSAIRAATEDEFHMVGCTALNVKNIKHPDNAVLPAWRDSMAVCLVVGFWDFNIPLDDMLAHKNHLVDVILPTLEEATPGAGSYLNELDAMYKGDWKQELYGANYPRLMNIKRKYDPDSLLYGWTAVGSDLWTTDASGRICKK
ncbi:hypothetical protein DL765_003919 [Monosporascus sp. GIB2]|nr:hypothetical protein DL765_003919 [Monosporascus sp. GIB2]